MHIHHKFSAQTFTNNITLQPQVCIKQPKCDITKTTEFLQKFIPQIRYRSEIGNEAAFLVPDTNLDIFPKMLSELEKSLNDLSLLEYGLSISALDEVYINVCADHAKEGIEFNLELINCNRFRLHTGIRKYFVQWKAMFYKKFLFTFQVPVLFITQILIIACFAVIACLHTDMENEPHPPLNLSLDLYNDANVFLKISNETNASHKMHPLLFYAEDYFKKFQNKSTLTFISNQSIRSFISNPTTKLIEKLDVHSIGAFDFHDTENVSIFFNNMPLHSIPIMVLLWINLITKFELGEDYNVEVVSKPLAFKPDYVDAIDRNASQYAMFVSLGLSVAFAFFNYTLTRGRIGKQVLLQLLGGLRVSTLWLSNLIWDLSEVIVFVTIIVVISLAFGLECTETTSKILELYFILVYLGLGIILLSYTTSFWSTDPFLSVAFHALRDIIFTLIVFKGIYRIQTDNNSDTIKALVNITNDVLKIFPTYGTICVLFKKNKKGMTNTSCEEACEVLYKRFPKVYPHNCSAETLCTMDPPFGRSFCCCK